MILVLKYVNGIPVELDPTVDSIGTKSILFGGALGTEFTKQHVDTLVGGVGDAASLHTHNSQYFLKTQYVSSGGVGNAGLPLLLNAQGQLSGTTIDQTTISHSSLSNLGNDDHPQYFNQTRGDIRYFPRTAFLQASTGAASAGSPIALNSLGKIDGTMIDPSVISHENLGGLLGGGPGDHQHLTTTEHSIVFGDGTPDASNYHNHSSLYYTKSAADALLVAKANDADVLKKDGSVALAGTWSAGANKITNLADPVAAQDAATKHYVDTSITAAQTADLPLAGGTMSGAINMGTHPITNVVDPVNPQDAATKNYVDTLKADLVIKDPVKAVSTSNIALNATPVIDGYQTAAGDRVLIAGQTDATQNGIYVVAAGVWARSSDATTNGQLVNGCSVWVDLGSQFGFSIWALTTVDPISIGTTAQTWQQYSGASQINALAPLNKTGNFLALNIGNGLATVANSLAVDLTQLVGNGVSWDVPTQKFSVVAGGGISVGASVAVNYNANKGMYVDPGNANVLEINVDGTKGLAFSVPGASPSKIYVLNGWGIVFDASGNVTVDNSVVPSQAQLTSAISNEASQRTAADNTLQTNLTNEVTRAEAAEALLLDLAGTRPMTGALNMNTHLINGVVDPVAAQDAATKNYVDANYLKNTGGSLSGDLDMAGHNIIHLNNIQDASAHIAIDFSTLTLKDATVAANPVLTWSSTGISLHGLSLTNLAAPVAGTDGANKAYVDAETTRAEAAEALLLDLAGTRPMTGALDMNTHKISGVVDPTLAQDATTKNYVDTNFVNITRIGAINGVASLDAGGKVPISQLPSSVMEFKGNWDASTNTPTLADGTGTAGFTYRVSVAGTQNLGSGAQTFFVGDLLIYNGTAWQRSPAADGVMSVNGFTGVVTLTTDNIPEGATNEYFTIARAQSAAVENAINSGTTTKAPSEDAVFQALATKLNLSGGTMTGTLNMGAQILTNLPAPVSNSDAAPKYYVDAETSRAEAAESNLQTQINTSNTNISNNSTAISNETTRAEAAEAQLLDLNGTRAMLGNLNINGFQIHGLAAPVNASDASTKSYVDTETTRAQGVESGIQSQINSLYDGSFVNGDAVAHAAGDIVFLNTDGKVYKAQATNASIGQYTLIGVSIGAVAAGASGSYHIKPGMIIGGFVGLTIGQPVFISPTTAGGYQQNLTGFSTGNQVVSMGRVISATQIMLFAEYEYQF